MKTLHLNCLPSIYKIMQTKNANENVSLCSNTGQCITVKVLRILSRGNTRKPFKCDRGPIFQVANLNRNLTQFKPTVIHYLRDLTALNGTK